MITYFQNCIVFTDRRALYQSFSFAFECFRMVPTGAELTIHSPGLSLSHSGNTFYSAEDDVMVESASVVKEEKAMNSLNS